jgi:hypothetical protein
LFERVKAGELTANAAAIEGASQLGGGEDC